MSGEQIVRLPAVQATGKRLCHMESVLRPVLSGPTERTPRQGPIFISILGHRGKTQQKIQVDHIRSTIPSRSRGLRKYEVGQGASMPNASRACEEAPCVPRWTIPCRLLPPNPGPSEYPPDYSRPAPRPCPGLNSPRRSRAELHGLSGTCLLKLS